MGLVCGVQYYFMSKPTTVLSVVTGTKKLKIPCCKFDGELFSEAREPD